MGRDAQLGFLPSVFLMGLNDYTAFANLLKFMDTHLCKMSPNSNFSSPLKSCLVYELIKTVGIDDVTRISAKCLNNLSLHNCVYVWGSGECYRKHKDTQFYDHNRQRCEGGRHEVSIFREGDICEGQERKTYRGKANSF